MAKKQIVRAHDDELEQRIAAYNAMMKNPKGIKGYEIHYTDVPVPPGHMPWPIAVPDGYANINIPQELLEPLLRLLDLPVLMLGGRNVTLKEVEL